MNPSPDDEPDKDPSGASAPQNPDYTDNPSGASPSKGSTKTRHAWFLGSSTGDPPTADDPLGETIGRGLAAGARAARATPKAAPLLGLSYFSGRAAFIVFSSGRAIPTSPSLMNDGS